MKTINNKNLKAVLFAATAFLCFTIGDSIVKNIMTQYEPSFIASITYGSQTLYIVIFALLTGNFSKLYRTSHLGMQIIRGLGSGAAYLFFVTAIGKFNIPLTAGYAIFLSAPFWIALASLFIFKDQIGSHRWLAILLGFIGVLIILQPGTNQFSLNYIYPLLAALGFMVMVIASRIIGDKSIYELTFYILFIPTIMCIAYTGFTGNFTSLDSNHIPTVVLATLFYTTGIITMSKAFAIGESSAVAPIQYSQVLWGSLIGYFIFKQIPDTSTIIGAVIIVVSGIYLIYREHTASNK